MSIVGIAAEYNPFHNGHLWHMEQSLRQGARVIIALSGGFTQRGEPALLCKYARTEMALAGGASLVLEIPVRFACAGAEAFARGAVGLFSALGIVDSLCFGAENEDLDLLRPLAEIISEEPPAYKAALRRGLSMGQSFAGARVDAVRESIPDFLISNLPVSDLPEDLAEIMSRPNNILALEYLSAINRYARHIKPLAVKRKGAGHDAPEPVDGIASASYIRKLISEGADESQIRSFLPESAFDILNREKKRGLIGGDIDKYSPILHYILLSKNFKPPPSKNREFESILGKVAGILQNGPLAPISQIIEEASGKRFTKARIRRTIMRHILNLGPESPGIPAYARVLGFRREDKDILTKISQRAGLPLITNLKHASKLLKNYDKNWDKGQNESIQMLEEDLKAQALFWLGCGRGENEFSREMIII